jgi:hypothetical protein
MARQFKAVRFFLMKYFKQQGAGEQQSWDLAFENGYTGGFKKTHHRQ